MQELLARQSAIIKEIEKIHINYKKDSAIRKTSEYFQKRIAAIDNLWGEFEQNNKTLQGVEDKSSEYFKKEIYSEVKQFYTTLRATVTADSERPATPTISQLSTPSTSKENAGTQFRIPISHFEQVKPRLDYQEILAQQYANFRALERQLKRISEQDIEEKWEIEEELRSLQQRWHKIDELHLRIDILSSGTDTHYEEAFTEIESKYITAKRSLNQKLLSNAHLQQSLPQIDIPIFTGNYEEWPTFQDLYTEAIHNNKYITDAQKMQHLKCKLKGEAERMIQHLHISAENYEIAWEILNHRYDNPQLLFTKQVEILLSQPTSHKQSSYELKKLYDTTTECIHAIHNLGVDTNSWDPLLVHILCKKLDVDTYTNYQESRKEPRSLPTLEEFMTFIESKFTALEPIQHREKEVNNTSKQVYQAPTSSNYNKNSTWSQYQNEHSQKRQYQAFVTYRQKSCVVCKAFHDLYMCTTFFNLSGREQIEILQKHNICINCLYTHHNRPCISTRRCKQCNGPHNTKIHESVVYSNSKLQTSQNVDVWRSTSSTSLSTTGAPNSSKTPKRHYSYAILKREENISKNWEIKNNSKESSDSLKQFIHQNESLGHIRKENDTTNSIIVLGQDSTVKGDTFTLLGRHNSNNINIKMQHQQGIMFPTISTLNKFNNTSVTVPNTRRDDGVYGTIQQQIHGPKKATINDYQAIGRRRHHIAQSLTIKDKAQAGTAPAPPPSRCLRVSAGGRTARLHWRQQRPSPAATSTVTFPRLPRID